MSVTFHLQTTATTKRKRDIDTEEEHNENVDNAPQLCSNETDAQPQEQSRKRAKPSEVKFKYPVGLVLVGRGVNFCEFFAVVGYRNSGTPCVRQLTKTSEVFREGDALEHTREEPQTGKMIGAVLRTIRSTKCDDLVLSVKDDARKNVHLAVWDRQPVFATKPVHRAEELSVVPAIINVPLEE